MAYGCLLKQWRYAVSGKRVLGIEIVGMVWAGDWLIQVAGKGRWVGIAGEARVFLCWNGNG